MKVKIKDSLSEAIATRGKYLGVMIPSTWATADITFQVSNDGGHFLDLYDASGAEISYTPDAGYASSLASIQDAIYPFQYVRFRSGTSAAPVVQGLEKARKVFDFGDDKTLTFESGIVGSLYDDISVVFAVNDSDALAVSATGTIITIKLATETASNNADSAIQTEVQALTITGYDVTGMTVKGSDEYNSAPPVQVTAVTVIDFIQAGESPTSLGILTLTAGAKGAKGDFLNHISWGINTTDELSITYSTEYDAISIDLANETPSKNAATAIETALRAVTGTTFGAFLTSATVTGDATYNALPPVAPDSFGSLTAGHVDGADIPIPETANLLGGVDLEIDVAMRA